MLRALPRCCKGPPLKLRHLHGCVIPCVDSKTIWHQHLSQGTLREHKFEIRDWKVALDAAQHERTVISRSPTGEIKVEAVPVEAGAEAALLSIARERNISITLKGLTLSGLLDVEQVVEWICKYSFPSEDVKHMLADLAKQFFSITPTEDEARVFAQHPVTGDEHVINAEKFVRAVLANGTMRWTRGLYTLILWNDGSELLKQAEMAMVNVQGALKFMESNKDFHALLAPLASLVLQVEKAASPVVNFPQAVKLIMERRTVGAIDGQRVTLLRWMYLLHAFPGESIRRVGEGEYVPMLKAAAVACQDNQLAALEQVLDLCHNAISEDDFVKGTQTHVDDLCKMRKQILDAQRRLLHMYDPRDGKLAPEVLYQSAASFLNALCELQKDSEASK